MQDEMYHIHACQIFTHLKLWIAVASHNFKWDKIKKNNFATEGLRRWDICTRIILSLIIL